MSSVEVDQLLGRDTVTMFVTYDKGWKMPTTLSERMFMEHKHQKQHYDRKAVGGRYSISDLVWLYCPAVLKGHSAKLHQPRKGPFEVMKVPSDVTYCIKDTSAMGSQVRRRRKQLVVHLIA